MTWDEIAKLIGAVLGGGLLTAGLPFLLKFFGLRSRIRVKEKEVDQSLEKDHIDFVMTKYKDYLATVEKEMVVVKAAGNQIHDKYVEQRVENARLLAENTSLNQRVAELQQDVAERDGSLSDRDRCIEDLRKRLERRRQ